MNQTHITDYYGLVDSIQRLESENKRLASLLQHLKQYNFQDDNVQQTESGYAPLLKQMVKNAERNAMRLPKGRRHTEILKKFCTSLFIYAGPLAYEFIQQNLREALPCLRTVQQMVRSEYKPVKAGDFRFDGLVEYLTVTHNAPTRMVSIGEDATRVIARVEYDSESDCCVGFVLPLKENGLPVVDSFKAVSFTSIEKMFTESKIAKYAYVYMAQPLAKNIPPFCLACIGTNNKFTFETVLQRWEYIVRECHK